MHFQSSKTWTNPTKVSTQNQSLYVY